MESIADRARRLAVLIDAENASPTVLRGLFEEVASFGEAVVRRVYGDFSGSRLRGWTEGLAAHGLVPHQTFALAAGKNAADIALVVDAMDLLHTGRFDGFCLVSSDSDFTRLASRIREQGLDVYGFGERKTPASFRNACRRFLYTENLANPSQTAGAGASTSQPSPDTAAKLPPEAAVPHIVLALRQLEDADGWYPLAAVGARLAALLPDFDTRSYGSARLLGLVERSCAFEVRREGLRVLVRHLGETAAGQLGRA